MQTSEHVAGWNKLTKYYQHTDRSVAYVAATVLDPSQKWQYLEGQWDEAWIRKGKSKLIAYWKKHYKEASDSIARKSASSTEPSEASKQPALNVVQRWKMEHKPLPNQAPKRLEDELNHYLDSPVESSVENALAWWGESAQRNQYPNLSKMAYDFLSIPAMSAEPERVFSGARRTISDDRNRLSSESIEATEGLKCLEQALNDLEK